MELLRLLDSVSLSWLFNHVVTVKLIFALLESGSIWGQFHTSHCCSCWRLADFKCYQFKKPICLKSVIFKSSWAGVAAPHLASVWPVMCHSQLSSLCWIFLLLDFFFFAFLSRNRIHSLIIINTFWQRLCLCQVCWDRPVFVTTDLNSIISLVCFLLLVSTVLLQKINEQQWAVASNASFKQQHNNVSLSSRRFSFRKSFDLMNEKQT